MCAAEFASTFRGGAGGPWRRPAPCPFREIMQNVLIVIHLIIVVALVGVVLLQRSEGGGLGMGSGGGGVGGFMTGRGQANALTRATAILAGLFFLTSIVLAVMANRGRVQRSRPAHAIAHRADRPGHAFRRKRFEKGAGVADGHVLGGAAYHGHDGVLALGHGKRGLRVERPVGSMTIEKIRHQDRISLFRQPFGHAVEHGARTERVHVEDDAGLRPAIEQAGFRGSVLRPDPDVLSGHALVPCCSGIDIRVNAKGKLRHRHRRHRVNRSGVPARLVTGTAPSLRRHAAPCPPHCPSMRRRCPGPRAG